MQDEAQLKTEFDLLKFARKCLKPLASLQVTVVLFLLTLLLVFFSTLAQKNAGIWTIVEKYYNSWYVWVDLQMFVNFSQVFFSVDPTKTVKGSFPFPAGWMIGWAMFINLLSAHILRFRLTWKRSGIFILHAGVLLLLVGEYVTRRFQVEQQMRIPEGQTSSVAFDIRTPELAFVTPGETPGMDRVTVIPSNLLKKSARRHERISRAELPVDVEVLRWMPNSSPGILLSEASPELRELNLANQGIGLKATVKEEPEVTGTDDTQNADLPAAFVTLYQKGTDTELGRYLVNTSFTMQNLVETFAIDGKNYTMCLRFTQYHKPFKLNLIKFTHETYLGTNLPKNFNSRILIDDPEKGVNREVDIYMNEPLRYRGEAFYQSGFDNNSGTTTILQVVRNPGWLLPYLSCFLVSLGMAVHFLIFLLQFLKKKGVFHPSVFFVNPLIGFSFLRLRSMNSAPDKAMESRTRLSRFAGLAGAGVAILFLVGGIYTPRKDGKLDLTKVSGLPVVEGGRFKPLDTVARVYLRRLNDREDVTVDGTTYSAIKWYMEVASSPSESEGRAKNYPCFRIENLEVLSLLKLKPRDGLRYSFDEIDINRDALERAEMQAESVPSKQRSAFEEKVTETTSVVRDYLRLLKGDLPMTLPPNEGGEWRTLRSVHLEIEQEVLAKFEAEIGQRFTSFNEFLRMQHQRGMKIEELRQLKSAFDAKVASIANERPQAQSWLAVLAAYRTGDQERFDAAVAAHQEKALAGLSSGDRFRFKLELFLNQFAPFYHASMLYGFAFALSLLGWIFVTLVPGLSSALRRFTFWMLVATFLLHTVTLFSRMYLMDRPLVFVTNLYSSAIFLGWVAVGACLIIERIFPVGLGNHVAADMGLVSCIIAHNLATSDTLEMMRAVLDTNFWLATHVSTVTTGYSATFVAGVIGLIYLVMGLFTRMLDQDIDVSNKTNKKPETLGKVIGQAMYGVICAAMFFSFVGTVLGGIWADQSWGRFWGWDPKENGAVMIVIWNALILHARWCGLVKNRGTAILTLVGNMITTWSWFGTNQLGVGLHAYGFNNTLAMFCVVTWVSHLALIGIALSVPPQYWRSTGQKA